MKFDYYKDILKELVELGLIEIENKTNRYNNLNSYFIPTDKLLSIKTKRKIITDKKVIKSISRYYAEYKRKLRYYYPYLMKQVSTRFVISYDKLLDEIKNKYNPENHKGTIDEYIESRYYIWEMIEQWNNGSRYDRLDFYIIDDFGKRVHSIFTYLPKEIIKYNDTLNYEIDLHQSQPTMLAQYLLENIGENTFTNDINNDVDVYNKMIDYYQIEGEDDEDKRKKAKKKFYKLLYGVIYQLDEIEELYPYIIPFIKKLKTYNKRKYDNNRTDFYRLRKYYREHKNGEVFKPFAILSFILTRKETEIFRKIWERLYDNRIKFATRHDSIVVNDKHSIRAKQIMEEILQEELNVKFKINEK